MTRRKKRLRRKLFYSRRPKPDFGLRNGQMRPRTTRAVKNAGWYNRQGEKLGWGDLSMADMRRIAQSLRKGEMVILLSERDSFWAFVTKFSGGVGSECETANAEMAPGRAYVSSRCTHVISPRKIHVVERWGDGRRPVGRVIDGIACLVIDQDGVDELMRRKR